MFTGLITRAFWTAAYVLAAYVLAGAIATWLVGPSSIWWLVLAADFVLVVFCTGLARLATNDVEQESRTEALVIGIGTIAPIGVHALQFGLQLYAGASAQVGTVSVVGAAISAWWPSAAPLVYLTVLCGWMLASVAVAIAGALWARDTRDSPASHWIAIALLAGATLFLLPWFGEAVRVGNPLPTLISYAGAMAVIGLLVSGASWMVRGLVVAMRAAGFVAKTVVRAVLGICVALIPLGVLVGLALTFIRYSDPIFGAVRTVALALVWLIAALAVVAVAAWVLVIMLRLFSSAMAYIRKALGRLSRNRRRVLFALLCLLGLGGILVVRSQDRGVGGPIETPTPSARIEFEEAPISCFGFRWEYGETRRIVAPVRNCSVYSDANILVAVGSATPRGGPRSEAERALRRGTEFADAIIRTLASRQGSTSVYVLNLGIETPSLPQATRDGPRMEVFSGTIVPRGAELTADILARDLASYLRERPGLSIYSHCDLYAYGAAGQLRPPMELRDCAAAR